ncbi:MULTISPECIES: selenocysteine-specific translation elongation factor [unclassified Carboxydocella]|uniref:selenocysteine-specific translation elongation factor n=1 Tax=unclassified Carboxydocella TaxID=2685367 RepID=UPI0009ADEED6|nr:MULTISPECIES: selenocysteine-specific translation elongation factor [unclassified Carboxydocella]GAW29717.1 selenocysteine-specific translation factor [Carboxydocella sp. ULO1]GAW31780.1 selenocysteine-specific translation factor [Carboxydocella sp. JDF658]
MKRVIIGTAGHVDHGKTTLVKALTGHDTDRLKEEKVRGISIELGFAPFTLPSGQRIGLVDVPGHERFIKNMLAGVGGIDLVMLVIAADEGIMPQTREHLDIINLLQVKGGVVVITKADLVETEWLDLIREEVEEVLKDSVLAGAPVIAVSAMTGQGIPELIAVLEKLVSDIEERPATGQARLPIDRVFTITGFGTVVTGTLISGRLQMGQEVVLLPSGKQSRIRSLQVHGKRVEEARAGQRVAVNLHGLEINEVDKGEVLTVPGAFVPTYRLDVELEVLPTVEKALQHGQRLRFYLGTSEVFCRLRLLDREELEAGTRAPVQLVLEQPVVAAKRDRFIVRTYSPMHTVAGGQIIDAHPPRHRRYQEGLNEQLLQKLKGEPDELLLNVMKSTSSALLTWEELIKKAQLSQEEGQAAQQVLLGRGDALEISVEKQKYGIARDIYLLWLDTVKQILQKYHQQYPLRRGFSKEELRGKLNLNLSNKEFTALLNMWQQDGELQILEQDVALKDFQPEAKGKLAEAVAQAETAFLKGKFQPPSWAEVAEKLPVSPQQQEEVLLFLQQQGRLIKISDDLYFHSRALKEAKDILLELLEKHQEITLAQFRDALNSSRKYMVPLMEYFDRQRVTRRIGDLRVKF